MNARSTKDKMSRMAGGGGGAPATPHTAQTGPRRLQHRKKQLVGRRGQSASAPPFRPAKTQPPLRRRLRAPERAVDPRRKARRRRIMEIGGAESGAQPEHLFMEC